MLEPSGKLDLALETLGTQGGRQLWVENLEGNGTVVPEIVSEEHGGHSTATELTLQSIAVGQPVSELLAEVCHSGP